MALQALQLQLAQKVLTNVDDAAGLWQFEGGQANQDGKQVANYASVKRVISGGTDQNGQNSATVTTTILFLGASPPENMTLQGVHRFDGGDQTGSVSAASPAYAAYIGQRYFRWGGTNVIDIASSTTPA